MARALARGWGTHRYEERGQRAEQRPRSLWTLAGTLVPGRMPGGGRGRASTKSAGSAYAPDRSPSAAMTAVTVLKKGNVTATRHASAMPATLTAAHAPRPRALPCRSGLRAPRCLGRPSTKPSLCLALHLGAGLHRRLLRRF